MKKKQKPVSTPTVLQTEMTECGAACLAMILHYYGQNAELEELRLETDVSRDGCSAGNIVRAARRRGLDCEGFEVDISELTELTPPLVLWWEDNHFVVFEGVKQGEFYLNDPAWGKRRVSQAVMEKEFSGIVLQFSPGERFRKHPEFGRKPEALFRSGRRAETAAAFPGEVALTCGWGVLALAAAVTGGILLSPSLPREHAPAGRLLVLAAGLFLVLAVVLWGASRYRISRWQDKQELFRSWPYLTALLNAPISLLEDRYPEDLTARIISHNRVNRFLPEFISTQVIGWIGLLLSLCALCVTTHSPAAGIPLAASLLLALGVRRLEGAGSLQDRAKAKILEGRLIRTVFMDADKGETIRDMNCGQAYIRRILRTHEEYSRSLEQLEERDSLSRTIFTAILGTGGFLAVLVSAGGPSGSMGLLSAAFLAGMTIFFGNALISAGEKRKGAEEDYRRARSISNESEGGREEEEDLQSIRREYRKLNGNIEMTDLAFGYGNLGEPLLKGINLRIAGGTMTAVTGDTGSGKSTLGKLMAGLMVPMDGRVLYDGRDLKEIPKRVFRASVSTVKQKSTLFAGTIRENITLWNPGISDEEIRQAAADACISDCIESRPGEYDSLIGANGTGLSGGEQQRVEIARALAGNPSILILDEAFSAVDDKTTLEILESIRRRGCTCVLITRDPVLLAEAGQVIDLEDWR